MVSDKERIGIELKKMLSENCSTQSIADWAYNLSLDLSFDSFSQDLKLIIEDLVYMNAGPEFILPKKNIEKLATKLIKEGEKEELSLPIKSINDNAEALDEVWLLCPICIEAWESQSHYGMVRCPYCQKILHNPRYKKES